MKCNKFQNVSKIPISKEVSCGLCKLNPFCKLPQRRSPDDNGRTVYPARMDTTAVGNMDVRYTPGAPGRSASDE